MTGLIRRNNHLFFILALLLDCSCSLMAEDEVALTSYHLKVNVEPADGSIGVKARVEIPKRNRRTKPIKFDLHQTFNISKLLINGKGTEYSFAPANHSRLIPASKSVVVTLPADIFPDKIVMEIEYGGQLEKIPEFGTFPDQQRAMDDQINSHMIELAGHSSWYPQFSFPQPLQAELELSLPRGWISVCSGKKIQDAVQQGRSMTHWSIPNDMDILILASPKYRKTSVRQSGTYIEIYDTQMPKQFIDREVEQIARVVGLYSNLLGETNIPAGTVKQVYSPKRKGQGLAGIARPGMIVTSEGLTLESLAADPKFSLFQPIAHEIAHFWWNFGAGQGDWINESFAEYFSALAVEKISSKNDFQNVLETYRKQVSQLPLSASSLSQVPFLNDGVGFVVRYYKGALMLDYFRGLLGDAEFSRACREFFQTYTGRSIGTDEFRIFWRSKLASQGKSLDLWLDSPGRLPDLHDRTQSL